ncbi:enoyl-CoA hydratase/isomerase family protein [Streptomyces sp. NPDC002795]|uniref:enoyl-CoA hydratase/isomerase family protein n=1 Tax=Streptomyces sp. NPDC002795 TaxID=3364665 RepID=UPI003685EBDB
MTDDPQPSEGYKTLHIDQDGPVLTARLHTGRTDAVLDVAAIDDLLKLLDSLTERTDVKVLVLSSTAEDFCLGADRTEFAAAREADPTGAALRRIVDKGYRLCQALETTDTITIARLSGRVTGAGLALVSYFDLRVGADTSRYRMPEGVLGLPPAWGGATGRLITEVGLSRIRELMLTCREFDAATAHRIDLLHETVPEADLDRAVSAWTRSLSRRSHESMIATKRMLTGYARADRTVDLGPLDANLLTAHLA